MDYMGNKAFWDDKFLNRGNKMLAPESQLVIHLNKLKPGHVLDLACGDGRNTLFLLENNFDVTGVDFSHEALKRLERFSKAKGFRVKTLQMDLSHKLNWQALDCYDNIVINHYRLETDKLSKVVGHLNEGGILFVSGFSEYHQADERVGPDDLIHQSDFKGLDGHMDLVHQEHFANNIGRFVTYIYRKRSLNDESTL